MNTCPWCGTPSSKSYLKLKDYFLTKQDFEILECPSCGLLFTTPRPQGADLDQYYQSEEYYSHQENKMGFIPKVYEAVKSINLKNKVSMAIGGLPQGKLLDIGCGVGDFLVHVKQKQWDVVGVEPSEQARSIAEQRLQSKLLLPNELHQLPDASFDVITMWHVLEHVDNLPDQVSELRRLLKPGGRLLIALPNYRSFDCIYYKDKWAAWDVPRHLNHFSRSSIQNLFPSESFKQIETQKLKWDSYYISFLSERYLGHSLPLVRGFWTGLRSNLKAHASGEYSSLVYRFVKR